MTWPKVEEINANTNAARDDVKTYTAEEIAAAIQTLQAATESARDTILANLTSGGAVKKVQRGVITVGKTSSSATATISSVNTSKAVVLHGGARADSEYMNDYAYTVELTSSTVVTVKKQNVVLSVLKYKLRVFGLK